MAAESCEVALDWSCTAPPNLEGGPTTRATCFACGLPACTSCSVVRKWHSYGRRRICANCLNQNGLSDVVDRLARRHVEQ